MATVFHFTKSAIEKLPKSPSGPQGEPQRVTYRDDEDSGLQLRVSSTGVKTFSVYRRVKGGNPERVTLGTFPDITVERARKAARTINGRIAEGANPAEVKRALKSELTFAELFTEYLERHSKPNKRTSDEDESKFRQYLAGPLGGKKLSSITRADVAAVHSRITRDGHPTTANRVLALVSSVYGWAISSGLRESNPAKGIRRNPEHSRDRFLLASELPRFFASLAQEPNETIRDYILLSLLTGARRSNVLAMRWQDIDLTHGEWRIGRTKNNTPQTVTLSPEAIEILKRRAPHDAERRSADASGYVFPGSGKKNGHLVEPKKGWERIFDRDELARLTAAIEAAGERLSHIDGEEGLATRLKRARNLAHKLKIDASTMRIHDLRIHDLRRTLGSWQARAGSSLAVIGKSLNHKSAQTTAIYARLDLDPVRESVERATSAMLAAAGVKPSAEIRKLRGA
jgi:integrase